MTNKLAKIIFVVTEDWFFCSHRISIAKAALSEGYDVRVVTQVNKHKNIIESAGIKVIPFKISRSGYNPLSEIKTFLSLYKIYEREKPFLLHHVALKPILYGTIAASLVRTPIIINAVTGLGYVFTSNRLSAKIIKPILLPVLKIVLNLKNTYTIFQNEDDKKLLRGNKKSTGSNSIIIRGSGVDLNYYTPSTDKSLSPRVILASRMLIDKGIREFVEAARIVKKDFRDAKFVLAGDTDSGNPSMISKAMLDEWKREGIIEWEGYQENIVDILQTSNIACLPSYREGMPKFLLEAASCGLPIVATDVPGCREIVVNNKNGLLVPPKDPKLLADAIKILISDKKLRERFGKESRRLIENIFSSEIINKQTMDLYKSLFRKNEYN